MRVKIVKAVWVMRDKRNADLDYLLPATRAKELYDNGVIGWSEDEQKYLADSPTIIR